MFRWPLLPQMAIEPGQRALHCVPLVLGPPEAVSFTPVVDRFHFHTGPAHNTGECFSHLALAAGTQARVTGLGCGRRDRTPRICRTHHLGSVQI